MRIREISQGDNVHNNVIVYNIFNVVMRTCTASLLVQVVLVIY